MPILPVSLRKQEEEVEESWMKMCLGRRRRWVESGFGFIFISYCPTLLLIDNKLN